MPTEDQLKKEIEQLFDKEVFALTCGPSTGSRFKLEIGKKVLRERYINNPHLTEENRKFQGEYSLMVYCSWRLQDKNDKVIASWQDSNEKEGLMTKGLESLVGDKITNISFSPQFDCVINFTSGRYLNIFSDVSREGNNDTNWRFGIKGKYLILHNDYQLEYVEKR